MHGKCEIEAQPSAAHNLYLQGIGPDGGDRRMPPITIVMVILRVRHRKEAYD